MDRCDCCDRVAVVVISVGVDGPPLRACLDAAHLDTAFLTAGESIRPLRKALAR
jgi:hypothetical protein